MKDCLRLAAAALCLLLAPVHAADPVPAADVREAIEFPLPAVADVVGVQPAPAPNALIVIADANEGTNDCAAKALGFAVGNTLRVRAFGLATALSFTQPMSYWDDTRDGAEVAGLDRVRRVVKRIGASHFLRSSATAQDDGVHLHLELVDALGGTTLAASDRVSRSPEAALADMLPEALAPLSFALTDSEVPRMGEWRAASPAAFAALRAAFANNCAGANYSAEIEKAWRAQPDAPVLAALYAGEVASLYAASAVPDNLAAISARHPVVEMASALARVRATPQLRDDDALTRLKRIVATYPQEPGAWDALADALASAPTLTAADLAAAGCNACQPVPNHTEFAQAVAITLADAQRWPGNYRAWWGLAFALDRYADALRGGQYWSDMSEQATRRYPKLMELVGKLARRALEAHSGQASLYAMRIDVEANDGEDWYSTFTDGIAAAPHAWGLYNKAMNYAGNNWGGDARLRARIYHLAVDNNPQAPWPAQIYRSYAPGAESFFVVYARYLWIALFLAALVAALTWLLRRRSES